MMKPWVVNNRRGETIVEVLIAIVVLSSALGGAFAISNASVRKTQANHERYQATLLVNSYAEQIRRDYHDEADQVGFDRNTYEYCDPTSNCSISPVPDFVVDSKVTITSVGSAPTNVVAGSIVTYKIVLTWPSLTGDEDRVELLYGL